MCCGRKTPRKTGKRSKLIKKPLPNENDLTIVPEMPEKPTEEELINERLIDCMVRHSPYL